jgi:tripartite-type tricarboxylate transporter receptor subunit TctC
LKRFAKIALAALAAILSSQVHAQNYPTKTIRVVIPFAAGGGADTLTRLVLPSLRESFGGQTIIVENKPGAGTILGTETVARSAPDGYTLLVTLDQSMTMNPYLYSNLPYDPVRDFTPVSLMAMSPRLYVANPKVGVKTLKEMVEHAKANPGKVNYGSGAVSAQVTGQQLMDVTGAKMQFIPYNGGPPALAALLNNEVQLIIADIGTFAAATRDGRLTGLAVSGPRRSSQLPDIPTLREAGYPELENVGFWGMWAPAGTPQPIVAALHAAVVKAIADKEINQKITGTGAEPATSTPEELGAIVKRDQARWSEIIIRAGIKAN